MALNDLGHMTGSPEYELCYPLASRALSDAGHTAKN